MDDKLKDLENKIKDYRRFIVTLLILSIYLYLGAVIETYMKEANDGDLLFGVSFLILVGAAWFIFRYRILRNKLEDKRV